MIGNPSSHPSFPRIIVCFCLARTPARFPWFWFLSPVVLFILYHTCTYFRHIPRFFVRNVTKFQTTKHIATVDELEDEALVARVELPFQGDMDMVRNQATS